jgi:hypothetical protein
MFDRKITPEKVGLAQRLRDFRLSGNFASTDEQVTLTG